MTSDSELEVKSISSVHFGFLVGRVREVLEATITDKIQLSALTHVMVDRMYEWWKAGNLTTEKNHQKEKI